MREENGAYYVEPEEYEHLLELLKEQDNMEKAFEVPENEEAPKVEVSLYELNQMMVAQMPPMEVDLMEANFISWYRQLKMDKNPAYFMLLGKELSYYTLFHLDWNGDDKTENFWRELNEVLECAGPIRLMEKDTNGAFSIWVDWQEKGVCHCFYLFPYDEGVVEV